MGISLSCFEPRYRTCRAQRRQSTPRCSNGATAHQKLRFRIPRPPAPASPFWVRAPDHFCVICCSHLGASFISHQRVRSSHWFFVLEHLCLPLLLRPQGEQAGRAGPVRSCRRADTLAASCDSISEGSKQRRDHWAGSSRFAAPASCTGSRPGKFAREVKSAQAGCQEAGAANPEYAAPDSPTRTALGQAADIHRDNQAGRLLSSLPQYDSASVERRTR